MIPMVEMRKDPLSGDLTNYREYVRFTQQDIKIRYVHFPKNILFLNRTLKFLSRNVYK